MTYQTPTPDPTQPSGPAPGVPYVSVDAAADPSGYLAELLARHFRPGLADRLIRTWMPVVIGAVLSYINVRWVGLGLPDKPSDAVLLAAEGATIALYYGGATWVERRFPRLGRWLIALNLTKARPTYAEPKAADQVEAAAARTVARHY